MALSDAGILKRSLPIPGADGDLDGGGGDMTTPDAPALDVPTPAKADAPKAPSVPNPIDELKEMRESNRKQAIFGSIADNLANRQSFGNFFLHAMNPHVDASAPFRANIDANKQGVADIENAPKIDLARQAMDPSSIYSKGKQSEAKATFGAMVKAKILDKDSADQMTENLDKMNGYQVSQLMDNNPLMKQASDAMRSQAMMSMMGQRINNQGAGLDIRRDEQAAQAANKIQSSPLIQQSQRQLNQIGVDKHTLSSADVITPQMVHEIGAGIAGALNQGKAVGLGQMEMQDMATSQTKIAALEQMLTNTPKNGASPEIRKQMLDTLDRLEDSYRKVQAATAQSLSVGKGYAHNPAAQQAVSDVVQGYQPSGGGVPGISNANAASGPQDPKIAAWAKSYGYSYDQGEKIIKARQNGK